MQLLFIIYFFASNLLLAKGASFKELPDEIKRDIPLLMVDRQSDTPDSYMITEKIVGAILPTKIYHLTLEGLIESEADFMGEPSESHNTVVEPPLISVAGQWVHGDSADDRSANILGGFGTLEIENDLLVIPAAQTNSDTLAYYGARLLDLGDEIVFDTSKALPICTMSIGENYRENYLLKEKLGGGFYLEYHDMPHFHMPLNDQARGYLILGKKADDGSYQLSAFNIPFGKAIYTPGNIIHDDALLIGKYQVVYSVTENFSTVVVKGPEGRLAKVKVIE